MRATDIRIESPCGADWRTMKPSDTKRFCETCQKHVHDLSAMTAAEARALMESPPTEGLCVRYLYDAHGDVLFRPAPLAPSMLVRAKRAAARAAAVALPVAMAACSSSIGEAPQPMMMGAVACPFPAPSASASAVQKMGEVAPVVHEMMGAPPPMPPASPTK